MVSLQTLRPILDNDALTRGLQDPEARVLIEWLVAQAEQLATTKPATALPRQVERLCQRARGITRFVALWGQPRSRGAACQLAATLRFAWPLPTESVEPCELMAQILHHEAEAKITR